MWHFVASIIPCTRSISNMRSFNTAVCLWSYVKAFCRATTKSGFPPLKTSLALAWTHTHKPLLDRSLKTLKPVSPVFITDMTRRDRIYRLVYTRVGLVSKMFKASVWLTSDVVVGAEHHVCRVDEVVARAFHRDFHFTVTQNHPSSVQEKKRNSLSPRFLLCVVKQNPSVKPAHMDLHKQTTSTFMSTWCQWPWEWSPACVWTGRAASWRGSPRWTVAASAWRWRTERAAGEPTSRLLTSGSDHGPASGGRGSSGPGDKKRVQSFICIYDPSFFEDQRWSESFCFTRKPEELSSRQRKRQQKFLSRKDEFSGGMACGW